MDKVDHIVSVLAGSAANTFPCRLVWWSNPALPHYSQAAWLCMDAKYDEYLKSEAWRRKRAERLAIGKHRCAACGSDRELHLHHLTYARIFNEDMADLLPLCGKHHDVAEDLVARGHLPRYENVLFLATETVRLINSTSPLPEVSHRKTQRIAPSKLQETLLAEQWFLDAAKENRKVFKKLIKQNLKGNPDRVRLIANCFSLYDRKSKLIFERLNNTFV